MAASILLHAFLAGTELSRSVFKVAIAGTRGVPARHGGFETFADEFSRYLVGEGVDVRVYCQSECSYRDLWCGVRRVGLSGLLPGAIGTMIFDLRCVLDSLRERPDVVLTLGYNTAIFSLLLRLFGVPNVINMDGIEWKRDKWGLAARLWLRFNEWIGAKAGDRLIADHPEIKRHLSGHGVAGKTTVIPYGAHVVRRSGAELLAKLGVEPEEFFCVIARPEPENSILEIVSAFSLRSRGVRLLVLGNYSQENSFHRRVKASASDEVVFCGAIYDHESVAAIRSGCIAYVHGHRVGGTNPSLVEALGAGAAVIAHDNPYNRWVAADAALYFSSIEDLDRAFSEVSGDDIVKGCLRDRAASIHEDRFQWPTVLRDYYQLIRSV